jgi:hypothetical protein
MIIGYETGSEDRHEGRALLSGAECTAECAASFAFECGAGRFTLRFIIAETERSNLSIVCCDGAEAGVFAVPYTGNIDKFGRTSPVTREGAEELPKIYEKYKIDERYAKIAAMPKRRFTFDVPLALTEPGRHTVTVTCAAHSLNGTINTYNGEGFVIESVRLVRGIRAAAAPFERRVPGRSAVDLWGWMSMTSFDHPAGRVTPPGELFLRGIKEARKWGANNYEFLPVNSDGAALDLGAGWAGGEHYIRSEDKTWSCEEVRKIISLAQRCGMLTEFFIYCLSGADFIVSKMSFEEKINLFGRIAEKYGGDGADDGGIDGIITEAWFPVDAPAYINSAWRHNPALFHLSSNNDGAQYEIINAGYTPATHHYSAHWPAFCAQHTGYDHCFPLLPYPKAFYQKPEGTIFTYMQGCAETGHLRRAFPRIEYDLHYGITNRTVSPDWIVAQAQNFGLRRLMDESDNLAMALCWESDEETMCPEDARRYVYAASQDPVRLAAAYRLEDTGTGGEIDLKRNTRLVRREDTVRLRKRSPYPSSTTAIGNRFIQMLSLAGRDYTMLHCDLAGTASFYNNGALAMLAMPFCVTRFDDDRFLKKETVITESAGPKAVITEKSVMGSGYISFSQTAEYTVLSDIPGIKIKIGRRMQPGMSGEIRTFFGFTGYDGCDMGGGAITLSDSRGVLPEVALSIGGNGSDIRWVRGEGLYVTQSLCGSRSLEALVFVKTGGYESCGSEEAVKLMKSAEKETELSGGEAYIENDCGLDSPVIVRVKNAGDTPYIVRENGLWQHRGASPSQAEPGSDYVKLYLKKGEKGVISSREYISGAIRAGRGCQNMIAFSDVARFEGGVSAHLIVTGGNPMIFAPRVDSAESIASVRLGGEDWRYFSGRTVMLPNTGGDFHIEIKFGAPAAPALRKTYACVSGCALRDGCLVMRTGNQPWVAKTPLFTSCRALVETRGQRIESTSGCEVERQGKTDALIKLAPGENIIRFAK